MIYWQCEDLVIENYLTNKRADVSPNLISLLLSIDSETTNAELLQKWKLIPRASEIILQLIAGDILLKKNSDLYNFENRLQEKWEWGIHARAFHFSTQNLDFESGKANQEEYLKNKSKIEKPPSPYKSYGKRLQKIPAPTKHIEKTFIETLLSRRTHRAFERRPISLEQFGTILGLTWGKTSDTISVGIGENILKSSPSGGSRHPIEVYCIVNRVENVEPGIHHYSVEHHSLEYMSKKLDEDELTRLFCGQDWLKDSSAVFIMTGVLERQMWKYQSDHAYRVLLLDAGHLGQTFHLVVTSLNLAPFTCAAVKGTDIEKTLGLDSVSECFVYAAAVGIKKNWKS